MRKVLAVFAALAVAAGVVVFWQPVAAAGAPAAPHGRHPTARVCPDNGKLLVCFAIRQTDTVVPNLGRQRAAQRIRTGRPAQRLWPHQHR